MKISYIILLLLWLPSVSIFAQAFKKDTLSAGERQTGLMARYLLRQDEFAGTVVELYRDHTFKFNSATCLASVYSRGIWKERGGNIVLNSFYRKGMPIKIKYLQQRDSLQNQVIRVVENLAGVPNTWAMVQVNTDSTEYFPLIGNDNKPTGPIKRVRIRLESGTLSNWVKVSRRPFQSLQIVMNTALDMEGFVILNKMTFNTSTGKIISKEAN